MRMTVQSQWFATARASGVSDADCERIAGAFVYAGLVASQD